MSTQAAGKKNCTLNDVMEIAKSQPWQNSSQTSVFWKGTECHCQVAEFLLHGNMSIEK
jgi:hypothetical protein